MVEGEEGRVEGEGWRVEGEGWRVEGGGCGMRVETEEAAVDPEDVSPLVRRSVHDRDEAWHRVEISGFRLRVESLGFKVWGSGFRV